MGRYPTLLQINARPWLRRLSDEAGRRITLADIDDAVIARFAESGFDWIWLLSVWQTGAAGRAVSRSDPKLRAEFKAALPDLIDDDICGSGFAITAYTVGRELGGDSALAAFRERLAKRGIKLMLDFVPNHTAPDHAWVRAHPDFYVAGNEVDLSSAPQNYLRVETDEGPRILAHGRDPNFPGWQDTLQLNYANAELCSAQINELMAIAGKCDGVRCDMAMLIVPEIFQRTWRQASEPFWPRATTKIHEKYPAFTFMAEVYWDMEWTLQQQGFAYCYDKRLYDRLKEGAAGPLRDHFRAGLDYQDKLARFLENHDEPRAAAAFPWPRHQAAAVLTFLSPGLRFFQDGQFEGARVRLPTHLCRGPREPANSEIASFYALLLRTLSENAAFRSGFWSQIDPQPAWPGNLSNGNFIAFAWDGSSGDRYLVIVNYADDHAQCRLALPFAELPGRRVRLTDVMGIEVYEREGTELSGPGLYIDLPAWRFNVFKVTLT